MKRPSSSACALALLLVSLGGARVRSTESPRHQAWSILQTNWEEKSTEKRVQAVRVLALLPRDLRAIELVKKAAVDEKSDVRAAAATVLGEMHAKWAVAILHDLLDYPEPSVALAAASTLIQSKDPQAYDAYYEFLTGGRKVNNGLIAAQMKTLKDKKKMAQIGVEGGIGFIPYAGIGLSAYKALHTDDVSPVRAESAKMLAGDPDAASGKALVEATADKSWLVRAAALEAIAKRGDPQLLDSIVPAMQDDNTLVRCTAAAAVIRLTTLANTRAKQ
jgi:HEAT repeat protein